MCLKDCQTKVRVADSPFVSESAGSEALASGASGPDSRTLGDGDRVRAIARKTPRQAVRPNRGRGKSGVEVKNCRLRELVTHRGQLFA
jgi:hypothetical protein